MEFSKGDFLIKQLEENLQHENGGPDSYLDESHGNDYAKGMKQFHQVNISTAVRRIFLFLLY